MSVYNRKVKNAFINKIHDQKFKALNSEKNNGIYIDRVKITFRQKCSKVKAINLEIEISDDYKPYFQYLETYFNVMKKEYCEFIIEKEIESRNKDLGIIKKNPSKNQELSFL
ncbi:MAG: hypothetical protein ACFE8A_13435 [Candidatus Hodarchaeota archaeon]